MPTLAWDYLFVRDVANVKLNQLRPPYSMPCLIPAFAGTIRVTGHVAHLTVLLNTVGVVNQAFFLAQFLVRQVTTLLLCKFEAFQRPDQGESLE